MTSSAVNPLSLNTYSCFCTVVDAKSRRLTRTGWIDFDYVDGVGWRQVGAIALAIIQTGTAAGIVLANEEGEPPPWGCYAMAVNFSNPHMVQGMDTCMIVRTEVLE